MGTSLDNIVAGPGQRGGRVTLCVATSNPPSRIFTFLVGLSVRLGGAVGQRQLSPRRPDTREAPHQRDTSTTQPFCSGRRKSVPLSSCGSSVTETHGPWNCPAVTYSRCGGVSITAGSGTPEGFVVQVLRPNPLSVCLNVMLRQNESPIAFIL